MGPYEALPDGQIAYVGNRVWPAMPIDLSQSMPRAEADNRVNDFHTSELWFHVAQINNEIHIAVDDYFRSLGALFTLLPLTTRMISSPGAVYGREAIDYTSDTTPIRLDWFDLPTQAFLAESSQIYLELALLSPGVDKVYSVYNSFRKESADPTHLSEFHHVEFEGSVGQDENLDIAIAMLKRIIGRVLERIPESVSYFLTDEQRADLENIEATLPLVDRMTFDEAMVELADATGDSRYKSATLANFGSWEEIKLTNLHGTLVAVSGFPLLEVPFYHRACEVNGVRLAMNTDIIWPGYREILGSGERIASDEELREKAVVFNLPPDDYAPYLQSRRLPGYRRSSGFGLGWERLVQGLLCAPYIWSACPLPRTDQFLVP